MQLGLTIEEFEYLYNELSLIDFSFKYTEKDYPLLCSIRSKMDFLKSL